MTRNFRRGSFSYVGLQNGSLNKKRLKTTAIAQQQKAGATLVFQELGFLE